MFPLRYVQILILALVTAALSASNVSNSSASDNSTALRNSNQKVVHQIDAEGSASLITQNKLPPKDPPRMGREHVIDKPQLNSTSVPKIMEMPQNTSKNVANLNDTSGQKAPEHAMKKVTENVKLGNNNTMHTNSIQPNSKIKDTIINSTGIAKENNSTLTSTNITIVANSNHSTTAKPRKPTITEHDDVPQDTKSEPYALDIPSIGTTFEKKTKQADYVIPIVAIILSIPLVAIIFSVLFKRSKDWWQHRNYKRVDFLIEGMYQS